ncbi:hypothetical protein T265_08536 [Opisthorchis viverrini]|uniref:LRRCT domain-containing protein n=2 Tax=Opisthorchis viverrini TaxID=6198 RepID=A0A075A800_OPIVI|nr:hypothetical protein T265_08536 [Opisthorchis viverrini]KER23594.1 hypothetical protein T265_08536 [Opisthorchis viverrini]
MLCFHVTVFGIICGIVCTSAKGTYIRGSNGFSPCTYSSDPNRPGANILICDEEACREFGDSLPIIDPEGIPLSIIRIMASPRLTRCPSNAFFATQSSTGGSTLQTLEISGAHLFEIEPNCFTGLTQLIELRILNAKDGEKQTDGMSSNLLNELRKLERLETLHLTSVDLSTGIPDRAFAQLGHLRVIQFERNRLTKIGRSFLPDKNVLKELRFEGQPEGWKLLENSDQWARNLWALESISFAGSQMQPPQAVVKMNFGELVNRRLRKLALDASSITHLTYGQELDGIGPEGGVDISPLGMSLKELSLDRNLFRIQGPNGTALDGLRTMRNLRYLSINQNARQLYQVPSWFGSGGHGLTKLKEIQVRESGLRYIPLNAFPASTEVLQLSDNGLMYVDEGWADNLRQLRELYMNGMRLVAVHISGHQADWARAFRSLTNTLELLSMHGCQLRSEDLDANDAEPVADLSMRFRLGLGQLKKLKTLILSNNELTYIPDGLFQGLPELRNLALAGNQLGNTESSQSLRSRWTRGRTRPRLQRIDLRRNQITTLNRCDEQLGFDIPLENLLPKRPIWLAGETENNRQETGTNDSDVVHTQSTDWLGGLALTENPLNCDCRLAWLRQYVMQVRNQVAQSQPNHILPKGYKIYEKEALDFICADTGRWTQRHFLSLTPMDLYAVEHASCNEQPDIYGDSSTTESALIPCAQLRPSNTANRTRVYMLSGFRFATAANTSRTAYSEEMDETSSLGLSTGAFVIVIIAGALLLCFVLFTTIIILWLCVRVQRQERWRKHGSQALASHRQEGIGWCCGTNPHRILILCACCSRQPGHLKVTTSDTSPPYIPDNCSLQSKIGHSSIQRPSVYDEPGDSYYSRMSNNADLNETGVSGEDGGDQTLTLQNRRRRQKLSNQKRVLESESDRPLNSTGEEQNQDRQPVNVPLLKPNTAHSGASECTLKASIGPMTVEQPGSPPVPLPPVPTQRKTRSTADLRYQLSPHPQRGTSMVNECRSQELLRLESAPIEGYGASEYRRVLPWRSESVPHSQRNHTFGKDLLSIRSNRRLVPVRLTKSTCPKVIAPSEVIGVFEDSKLRFQSGWSWLKKLRRKKETIDIEPDNEEKSLNTPLGAETENLREMQGPDLPKPQTSTQYMEEGCRGKEVDTKGYLVMSPEEDYMSDESNKQRETSQQTVDEYIEQATKVNILQSKLARDKLGRRTSKSDRNQKPMSRHAKHSHPLLSDSVYTGIMYDDLPPPPPPPPIVSSVELLNAIVNKPPTNEPLTTISKGYVNQQRQGTVHGNEANTRSLTASARTGPPVGPKPKNIPRPQIGPEK